MPERTFSSSATWSGVGFAGSTTNGNGALVVAPTVTVSGPEVAPVSTVVISAPVLAVATGVRSPLSETPLTVAMLLNPSPLMVIGQPTGAEGGLTEWIASTGGACTVKTLVTGAGSSCPSWSLSPAGR